MDRNSIYVNHNFDTRGAECGWVREFKSSKVHEDKINYSKKKVTPFISKRKRWIKGGPNQN